MRNKYRIIDLGRRDILFASEESEFVKRQLFGFRRPLTLKGLDMEGNLQLTRGVSSPDSSRIWTCLTRRGKACSKTRRFGLLSRRCDLTGSEFINATVSGPIHLLRPQTFWVCNEGCRVAKIAKMWDRVKRDLFSAAGIFGIEFSEPDAVGKQMRWLTLGATLAIDLDFFERHSVVGG